MPLNSKALRNELVQRLAELSEGSLDVGSRAFFESLGYRSQRTLAVHSLSDLLQLLDPKGLLTRDVTSRWRSVDFLFQRRVHAHHLVPFGFRGQAARSPKPL